MTLRDEALSHGPNYQKRQWVLDQLGDDADEFIELEADPRIPPNGLYHALNNRGIKVSHGTVHRWCQNARRRVSE